MESNKKNLSAARRKLQEYKSSKGVHPVTTTGGASNLNVVNEAQPHNITTGHNQNGQSHPPPVSTIIPPPPKESIPEFLNNISQDLQSIKPEVESPLLETTNFSSVFAPNSSSFNLEGTSASQSDSEAFSSINHNNQVPLFTPSAPSLGQINLQTNGNTTTESHNMESQFTDAGQQFPVSFFQSAPVALQYQPVSFNPAAQQQDFYYNNNQTPQTTPMFYNVDGNSITPIQPYQMEGFQSSTTNSPSNPLIEPVSQIMNESELKVESKELTSEFSTSGSDSAAFPWRKLEESIVDEAPQNSLQQENLNSAAPILFNPNIMEENRQEDMQTFRMSTPPLRRSSVSSQGEGERVDVQRMMSVQDALELQLEELRRDNERLLHRQSELISQMEDNEKNVQELRNERDRAKEEAKKFVQPLNAKINNLYDENQRILKNSNEVGMDIRSKLQEKTKQFEDMEQAFIVVSKSKMDLAAELDQQREKESELKTIITKKDEEITELKNVNAKLEEKLKVEQQKEAIIHQLEDQRGHFRVQTETLQGELARANNKIQHLLASQHIHPESTHKTETNHEHHHHHESGESCSDHQNIAAVHGHDHTHEHSEHGSCDHDHQNIAAIHSHDHTHEEHGSCDHNHDHTHEDVHDHSVPRPPEPELVQMKKRLHHLEWENLTFRADVDKLAIEAKEKKQYEEKCNKLSSECEKLKTECDRLESLVVQLQGENDTIGDYIALYQTQRMALKESAKEKDVQLENLAKEREMLLRKMAELTQLVKGLKEPKITEALGQIPPHQCTSHEAHAGDSGPHTEIEGKIMNLISEISSSNLIEKNFHPCAVCSGRLMNV